jgi:hypothetical protein
LQRKSFFDELNIRFSLQSLALLFSFYCNEEFGSLAREIRIFERTIFGRDTGSPGGRWLPCTMVSFQSRDEASLAASGREKK